MVTKAEMDAGVTIAKQDAAGLIPQLPWFAQGQARTYLESDAGQELLTSLVNDVGLAMEAARNKQPLPKTTLDPNRIAEKFRRLHEGPQ